MFRREGTQVSIKSALKKRIIRHLYGLERRSSDRAKAEARRRKSGEPHRVEYYHEAGDPYSALMVEILPEFCQRYDVELEIFLVPPPPDWAAPERDALRAYSARDAEVLAERAGLYFKRPNRLPSAEEIAVATAELQSHLSAGKFLEKAFAVEQLLWGGGFEDVTPEPDGKLNQRLVENASRRDALGHYLGGTIFYGGEWYWGIDRLHYLEARLTQLGVRKPGESADFIYTPPASSYSLQSRTVALAPELHWYLSFRSPYTAIVYDRVKALADAYGADLKLRYVLPMVMRNLPVPQKKGSYIMKDTFREAERLGVPFGNISDPVGKPVERAYSLFPRMIELGKGYEYARAFLQGVWADGIDAGSDKGLARIVERAGVDWKEMKPLIGDNAWREVAEQNRLEMLKYDLWGVPSFRVGEVATWGQDRLWVIEEELARLASNSKGGVAI